MIIDHDNRTPFTWWLKKIDKILWKPDYSELIILFWYMSSWKTEFSYFTARENAKTEKVCYISLELDEYNMKLRICRKRACVSKYDYQTWNYTENQKQIMDEYLQEIESIENLRIKKPQKNTLLEIERTIRMWYDAWFRMFVIDNLDKILWDEDEIKRHQHITSSLQDLKNELRICIILIHHAKKPPNKQQQYMPAWMSWLRGSQKILDNATQVIEIFRDLDPEQEDKREKSKVMLFQYKDTFEWWNGITDIYFKEWNYHEQYPEPM